MGRGKKKDGASPLGASVSSGVDPAAKSPGNASDQKTLSVADELAALRADCDYDEEGEGSVDSLIDYKNALEDLLYSLALDIEETPLLTPQRLLEAGAKRIADVQRELKQLVADDYLARGGSVPPTEDQEIASYWVNEQPDSSGLSDQELDAIYGWYEDFWDSAGDDAWDLRQRAYGAADEITTLLGELGINHPSSGVWVGTV